MNSAARHSLTGTGQLFRCDPGFARTQWNGWGWKNRSNIFDSVKEGGSLSMKLRAATVIGLLTLVLPAFAGKPTITMTPAGPFTIPAGPGGCTFDVSVVPTPNRPNGEKEILFTNTAIISGPLFFTFTNVSNPAKTLTLNVSGPGIINFTDSSEILLGPSFYFGFPTNVTQAANLPAVALVTGRTILTFDNLGILSITHTGTSQDICQALT
jgi:hypothetical protein